MIISLWSCERILPSLFLSSHHLWLGVKAYLYWCAIGFLHSRFGSRCARIFRLVLQKRHLEQKQVEDFAMIPAKEAKDMLYKMLSENFISLQVIINVIIANQQSWPRVRETPEANISSKLFSSVTDQQRHSKHLKDNWSFHWSSKIVGQPRNHPRNTLPLFFLVSSPSDVSSFRAVSLL